MKEKIFGLIAANFNTLYKIAQKQFSKSKGLHLNSKDWKIHIKSGVANFIDFLINGIVNTSTTTLTDNMTYEQVIQFEKHQNIMNILKLFFIYKIPESEISTFIHIFLFNTRTRVKCSCPAFKYWGFEYILTRMNSVYGEGEKRFPIERNPNKEGVFCKHLWVITESLYNKKEKFARGLIPFFKRSLDVVSDQKINSIKRELGKEGIKTLYKRAKNEVDKTENSKIKSAFDTICNSYLSKLLKEINKKPESMIRGLNRINKQEEKTLLDETEGLEIYRL